MTWLIFCYSWLSSFLKKSLHLIRVANHKDNLSKEELEEECEKLKTQIRQLQVCKIMSF